MKNKKKLNLWGSVLLILAILLTISLFLPTSKAPATESVPEFVEITKTTPTPTPTEAPKVVSTAVLDNTPSPTDEPVQPSEQPSTLKPTADPTHIPTEVPVTVCSVAVQCQNALAPDSGLGQEIREVLPTDGVILQVSNVSYQEGDTAFDVLSRELKSRNILFEYNENPMFNSVYIEGINHLYEFDCGSQSGWLYFINGKSPGSGCSQYVVQPGDYIEFVYTCNFGNDIF